MTVLLYHLGDLCTPGLIINEILGDKNKKLFMLARYEFNNIISYLNDNNLDSIYDKKYLTILNNTDVKHTKYNFLFNHDYNSTNGTIINYDAIVLRFKEKINDWKNMCDDKVSNCIFLHFSSIKSVDELNIQEMMTVLKNQRPEGPIHLFIFTNKPYNPIDIPYVSIIQLIGEKIMLPWEMTSKNKKIAASYIYSKFIQTLTINNIKHDFPATY